jgi:hypothetical protein
MIDPTNYLTFSGISHDSTKKGGQELILFEILSILSRFKKIWVPFYSTGTLTKYLEEHNFIVSNSPHHLPAPVGYEALYFGTPTILNDRELFKDAGEGWNKELERKVVQTLVQESYRANYKMIVSGLGSGDISVEERLADMGGGRVACFKDFGTFQDWILVRRL